MTTTEPRLATRRLVDPTTERRFQASMRNDFLTPRGTPYKWQELTARVSREVIGGGGPTVVPVRYRWQRVDARTGTPTTAGDRREWTFARGQSFRSVLLHTDLDETAGPAAGEPTAPPSTTLDISYPELPKAPAVDLLLMLSWDVITFDMMCTHMTTTPGLRRVGGSAELPQISGTWAELTFSDPGAVAVFRNARVTARHLGYGRFGGRPSAVYSSQCLDCPLDVRSGPVTQRGRSSYWVTLQVDLETGDLLSADMTEMIVATLTGRDGRSVPVQKRRLVEMRAALGVPVEDPDATADDPADPAVLAEAVRLAGRVSDHVRWQTGSLETLPQGVAELALMGFRSMLGADSAEVYRQVRALRTGLQALADGEPGAATGVRKALPEHRRRIEGLLAFGQIAVSEAIRLGVHDEPSRKALHDHMRAVSGDLSELLALLERIEGDRPA
jgi:hypothetical protein